jgi:hypothetical protein
MGPHDEGTGDSNALRMSGFDAFNRCVGMVCIWFGGLRPRSANGDGI